MTNDYGKSKYETERVIDSIKTKIVIDETRKKGASPLQVADAVMKNMDLEILGKEIKLFAIVREVYTHIPGKPEMREWRALDNFAFVAQGYLEHPNAIAWFEFFENAKTVMDVLDYVLTKEELRLEEYLSQIPGLDKDWFRQNAQNTPILKFNVFGLSEEDHAKKTEVFLAEHKKAMEKVEEQERVHKKLMED